MRILGGVDAATTVAGAGLAGGLLSQSPGQSLGLAAAGTMTVPARADHVHPLPSLQQLGAVGLHCADTPPADTSLLWLKTSTRGLYWHDGACWAQII